MAVQNQALQNTYVDRRARAWIETSTTLHRCFRKMKWIIAPKALERFKHRIREVTRRAKGVSIETTIAEPVPCLRGWRSYFGFCESPDELMYLTR